MRLLFFLPLFLVFWAGVEPQFTPPSLLDHAKQIYNNYFGDKTNKDPPPPPPNTKDPETIEKVVDEVRNMLGDLPKMEDLKVAKPGNKENLPEVGEILNSVKEAIGKHRKNRQMSKVADQNMCKAKIAKLLELFRGITKENLPKTREEVQQLYIELKSVDGSGGEIQAGETSIVKDYVQLETAVLKGEPVKDIQDRLATACKKRYYEIAESAGKETPQEAKQVIENMAGNIRNLVKDASKNRGSNEKETSAQGAQLEVSPEDAKQVVEDITGRIVDFVEDVDKDTKLEDVKKMIEGALDEMKGKLNYIKSRPDPFDYQCRQFGRALGDAVKSKKEKQIKAAKNKIIRLCNKKRGKKEDEDEERVIRISNLPTTCRHKGKEHDLLSTWKEGKFTWGCERNPNSKRLKFKAVKLGCVCNDGTELKPGNSRKVKDKEYTCEKTDKGSLKLRFKRGGKQYEESFQPATDGNKQCGVDMCAIPSFEERAVCEVKGDPHTYCFDGTKHDYQGTCRQILVQQLNPVEDVPEFRVILKNEYREGKDAISKNGNARVSFVKYVELEIYGLTIRLDKGGKLLVNGSKATAPFFHPQLPSDACDLDAIECKLNVLRKGTTGLVLNTDFGLSIDYDGTGKLKVSVPQTLKGALGGTCGMYDGEKSNDLMFPNGKIGTTHQNFGDAWRILDGEDPQCATQNDEGAQCSKKQRKAAEAKCSVLKDESGPFAQCLADPVLKATAETSFEDCVYDVCAKEGDDEVRCFALEMMASECIAALNTSLLWRGPTNCPMTCQEDMSFKTCGPSTVATCDSNQTVYDECIEGCFCPEGLVLENGKCSKYEDCGCDDAGVYRAPGESWRNDLCTTTCTCQAGGDVECVEENPCEAPNVCVTNEDGEHVCDCAPGFLKVDGECVDRDECAHEYVCSNGQLCSICGAGQTCTNTQGSFTCSCPAGQTMIGGLCDDGKCRAKLDIVFVVDSSGSVNGQYFDAAGNVLFLTPDNFQKMKTAAKNMVGEFEVGPERAHFATMQFSSSKIAYPQPAGSQQRIEVIHYLNKYEDATSIQNAIQGMVYIGKMTATGEALRMVQNDILTTEHGLRNGTKPMIMMLVDGIQNSGEEPYVVASELKAAGYKIIVVGITEKEDSAEYKNQLTRIGSEVILTTTFDGVSTSLVQAGDMACWEATTCPNNTVKTSCGSACPPTCSNPEPICTESCVKGCFCAEGLIMDPIKEVCVPQSSCGCMDDYGIYREVDATWINSDCDEKCTCAGEGQISCVPEALCTGPHQSCEVDNGIATCHCDPGFQFDNGTNCVDIDECIPTENDPNGPCGDNEDCINSVGSYKCECSAGYKRNETTGLCEDINECEFTRCGRNEECINRPGSFDCNCTEGYERDRRGKCKKSKNVSQEDDAEDPQEEGDRGDDICCVDDGSTEDDEPCCDEDEPCEGEECCPPTEDDEEESVVAVSLECEGGAYKAGQSLADICTSATIINTGEAFAANEDWFGSVYVNPAHDASDADDADWAEDQCVGAMCKPPTPLSCFLSGGLIDLTEGLPSGNTVIDLSQITLECEDGSAIPDGDVAIVFNLDPLHVQADSCVVASVNIELEAKDNDGEICNVMPDLRTNGLSAFITNGNKMFHFNPMRRGGEGFFRVHKFSERAKAGKMRFLQHVVRHVAKAKGCSDDKVLPPQANGHAYGHANREDMSRFLGIAKLCRKNDRMFSAIRKMSCGYREHLGQVFGKIFDRSTGRDRKPKEDGKRMPPGLQNKEGMPPGLQDKERCVFKNLYKASEKAMDSLATVGPKKLRDLLKRPKQTGKRPPIPPVSAVVLPFATEAIRKKRAASLEDGRSVDEKIVVHPQAPGFVLPPNLPPMGIAVGEPHPNMPGGWGAHLCDDTMMDSFEKMVGADRSPKQCPHGLPEFMWKVEEGRIYQGHQVDGDWDWRSRAICSCEQSQTCSNGNDGRAPKPHKKSHGSSEEKSGEKSKGSGGSGEKSNEAGPDGKPKGSGSGGEEKSKGSGEKSGVNSNESGVKSGEIVGGDKPSGSGGDEKPKSGETAGEEKVKSGENGGEEKRKSGETSGEEKPKSGETTGEEKPKSGETGGKEKGGTSKDVTNDGGAEHGGAKAR